MKTLIALAVLMTSSISLATTKKDIPCNVFAQAAMTGQPEDIRIAATVEALDAVYELKKTPEEKKQLSSGLMKRIKAKQTTLDNVERIALMGCMYEVTANDRKMLLEIFTKLGL